MTYEENNNWIKVNRNVMDGWAREKFSSAQAWIDLIILANWKDTSFIKHSVLIKVERGQLAYSKKALQEKWSWSNTKVTNFLRLLVEMERINTKTTPLTTVITILNYDKYQTQAYQNNNESISEAYQSNTENIHYKKVKESKEVKKERRGTSFTPNDMAMAHHIFERLQEISEHIQKPNFDNWANVIRLMRYRDKIPAELIRQVFDWSAQGWWKGKVLSPSKLREKFATLHGQMKNNTKSDDPRGNMKLANELLEGDPFDE